MQMTGLTGARGLCDFLSDALGIAVLTLLVGGRQMSEILHSQAARMPKM